MSNIQILEGDAFELIKQLPDKSVNLVITSPPYADIIGYGKNISVKKPTEYVDWLLPLFNEIERVLTDDGSFILNINHYIKNGVVNPFVYELIYRSQKETKLKLYSDYYWHKMSGIPNGGAKRFRDMTEFIFHFVKNPKNIKFYMDRVLEKPAEETLKRAQYQWSATNHGKVEDGVRVGKNSVSYNNILKNGIRPDNVFRFPTANKAKDNTIKHPAPFYYELPEYFIKFLTDEGDNVLDPFGGIMTTGIPCKEHNRNFIGYDMNPLYVEFGIKRLDNYE